MFFDPLWFCSVQQQLNTNLKCVRDALKQRTRQQQQQRDDDEDASLICVGVRLVGFKERYIIQNQSTYACI